MGEGGWRLEGRWKGKLEGWKGGVNKKGECWEEGRIERVDSGDCVILRVRRECSANRTGRTRKN
jgi:hypothetical protein